MASVYALRLFIRAMHNRAGKTVESREITVRDGLVLVPIIAVIVFMARVSAAGAAPQRRVGEGGGGRTQAAASRHIASSGRNVFASNGTRATRTASAPPDRSPMTPLLATAHLKGPHIDWAMLAPLIALLGGAAIVLLVGLIGSRWVRAQLVPALTLLALGGDARADALEVGRHGLARSRARCGSTR